MGRKWTLLITSDTRLGLLSSKRQNQFKETLLLPFSCLFFLLIFIKILFLFCFYLFMLFNLPFFRKSFSFFFPPLHNCKNNHLLLFIVVEGWGRFMQLTSIRFFMHLCFVCLSVCHQVFWQDELRMQPSQNHLDHTDTPLPHPSPLVTKLPPHLTPHPFTSPHFTPPHLTPFNLNPLYPIPHPR